MKEILRSGLFKNIEQNKIKSIFNEINYSINEYDDNEVIAHEEDECNKLGLILEGNIELQRIFYNGNYIVLKKLTFGDVFGEALIFVKNSHYPATVISSGKSKILFIDKQEVIRLCLKEEKILENFLGLLSEKVLLLNNKVNSISYNSIRGKVINYILEESKRQKKDTIILSGTKEDISAYLGIPRPSFSRELINLKKLKLINYDRKSIKILDKDKLEKKLNNN